MATSHPLATRAGVRALEAGGNAVDAALAAAAMLTVCEPPHNGVGGDAFAQVWFDGALHGLNGSGRAPAQIDAPTVDPPARARSRCPARCARGRTSPSASAASGSTRRWPGRSTRAQRRGGDRADRRALACGAGACAVAGAAAGRALPPAGPRGHAAGDRRRAAPTSLYEGPIAAAIAAASWLSEDDLAAHRSRMGDAAAPRLPRRRGLRAAAQHAGRGRARGPRHRRRARRRRCTATSRRSSSRSTGPRAPSATRPSTCPTSTRCARGSAPKPHPTRACGPAPAPPTCARSTASATPISHIQSIFAGFGSGRGGGRDGDRAAQPRRGLHRGGGPPQPDRRGPAPVPHDHPRPAAARRRAARARSA